MLFFTIKHCIFNFKEICTDSSLISKEYTFYSLFKSCHNISKECAFSVNDSFEQESDRTELYVENAYSIQIDQYDKQFECKNKLSKGPLIIKRSKKVNFLENNLSIHIHNISIVVSILISSCIFLMITVVI